MAQMARNLTDPFDGFLRTLIRYGLMDRDTKFTAEFQAILKKAGVKPVVLLAKSPNSAYADESQNPMPSRE